MHGRLCVPGLAVGFELPELSRPERFLDSAWTWEQACWPPGTSQVGLTLPSFQQRWCYWPFGVMMLTVTPCLVWELPGGGLWCLGGRGGVALGAFLSGRRCSPALLPSHPKLSSVLP